MSDLDQDGDLIEIQAKLTCRNPVIQAQGFSQLVRNIQLSAFKSAKAKLDCYVLFFDCLWAYGPAPFGWLLELLPVLSNQNIFPEEEVFSACTVHIGKCVHVEPLLETLFEHFDVNCGVSMFIIIALLTDLLPLAWKSSLMSSVSLGGKWLRYFSHIATPPVTKRLNSSEYVKYCSSNERMKFELQNVDCFDLLNIADVQETVLTNSTFPTHVIFVPHLIAHLQARAGALKPFLGTEFDEDVVKIKRLIERCQLYELNVQKQPTAEEWNGTTFFEYIASQGLHNDYIALINSQLQSLDSPSNLLTFLLGLLRFCPEDVVEACCDLIVQIVVPEQSYSLTLYFITLFAKPFFPISRSIVLKTLGKLAFNQFTINPIVKFLCALSQQEIPERLLVFEVLGDAVERFPTVLGTISAVVTNFPPGGNVEEFSAKVELISRACKASDNCDELLSTLSALLKSDGEWLAVTLNVVRELCKEDVLEFSTVRNLLTGKVRAAGNERAFAAYCQLLSLGSVPNNEATDDENDSLRSDCIRELWQIVHLSSASKNDKVRELIAASAWTSLGDFDPKEVMGVAEVSYSELVDSFARMPRGERKGFVKFLRAWLAVDIEELPRPLYTVRSESNIPHPFFGSVDNWFEFLSRSHQESPWFWQATLPLTATIIQLTPSADRPLRSLKFIRSLIVRVPEAKRNEELSRLFAGWRICIGEATNALVEAKGDVVWMRDQIADECRRALQESTTSANNVMVVLTVLADHISALHIQMEDRRKAELLATSQKPWLISVAEYVMQFAKACHKPKTNPLFQIFATKNDTTKEVALFCLRFLAKKPCVIEFFGKETFEENCVPPEFAVFLDHSECSWQSKSRETIWTSAEALGADYLTTSAIEKRCEIGEVDVETVRNAIENATNSVEVEKALKSSIELSEEQLKKLISSTKKLDKMWKTGDDAMRRAIYIGCSNLARISWSRCKEKSRLSVEKLPDASLLKVVCQLFGKKKPAEDANQLIADLLPALIEHKRSDGRGLPPLDWNVPISFVNWRADRNLRKTVICLACEQSLGKTLYEATANDVFNALDDEEFCKLAANLDKILAVLPAHRAKKMLEKFCDVAQNSADRKTRETVAAALSSAQKFELVADVLCAKLPVLNEAIQMTNTLLVALEHPNEFYGKISRHFDFWLQSKQEISVEKICDLMSKETDELGRSVMLCILGVSCMRLSEENRFAKILDLVTATRLTRSHDFDVAVFFPLFMVLVTSTRSTDLPLSWFGCEEAIIPLMMARKLPFWTSLVRSKQMEEHCELVLGFLVKQMRSKSAAHWEKTAAADFVRFLLVAFPEKLTPSVEKESNEFWESLKDFK